MLHNAFIVLHTVAAVVCFVAAVLSLRLTTPGSWRFDTFLGALVGLLVFMVAAIAVDWPDLDAGTRLVYSGLVGLGLVMLVRALRARAWLAGRAEGWRRRYLDDLGFNLISLFDGFVIVAAIDLHAPGWLVAVIAVAGVVGGILAMNRLKARLAG